MCVCVLQDHDFFQHLEMYMRQEYPSLCGRDHLAYRSYYFPLKVPITFFFFFSSHDNDNYLCLCLFSIDSLPPVHPSSPLP